MAEFAHEAPLPEEVAAAVRAAAGRPRVLLASDYDGTLAPFVTDPMAARPAAGAVDALRAAAGLPGVSVALVSGRDLAVLRDLSRLGDDERLVFIGTHGAQTSLQVGSGALNDVQRDLLVRLDAGLRGVIAAHPGSRLERKPAAVVLHTRGMPEPANSAALDAAAAVAAAHPGCHPLRGKDVQEIGVCEADKGSALVDLARHTGADIVMYVGDDVTDERAFTALDPAHGDVTIKVGEGDTAARWRVADVAQAVACLQLFVDARKHRT
ncbi:MAG: trehalose-phosphatase [Dermatophilaceae bacterium]